MLLEEIHQASEINIRKQGRGRLSAFSHMDTKPGGGGVYRVTLRVYRNN